MSEIVKTKKNIGEQIADLLERQPQNFDVIFNVGPDKIQVKAVKIILKAASPVFEREFVEKWEIGVMKEGGGIPLPDLDSTVFELFVNLIISDTWEVDHLKSLNLTPNTLLSLLGLCRRYEILKAIENLEDAASNFIISFSNYKDTDEFLEMSRENLETVFACEKIPLEEIEIFECACRWADHQCKQKKIEPTGENFREVLGGCLFQIRFPTMNFEDFAEVSVFKKNIFSLDEKVEIYDFIGMKEAKKVEYDKSQFQYKTNPRMKRASFSGSVLRLPNHFKLTNDPQFVCDGSLTQNYFKVNKKISLHGVGFLGPIDGDSHLEVTVQIKRHLNCSKVSESMRFQKNIFARKGKVFHFFFDEPISIEPNPSDITADWTNCNIIEYTLKGPVGVSHHKMETPAPEKVQISGIGFTVGSTWQQGKPLTELLFKKA